MGGNAALSRAGFPASELTRFLATRLRERYRGAGATSTLPGTDYTLQSPRLQQAPETPDEVPSPVQSEGAPWSEQAGDVSPFERAVDSSKAAAKTSVRMGEVLPNQPRRHSGHF